VLQCVAVCCSVLQCVAVCCSVLQCVAVWQHVELPCRVGVPLESALNLVSRISEDYILQKRPIIFKIIFKSLLIIAQCLE